ncbi:MAG: hypothetical protein HKN24_00795 [Acidimicrobiales bacterium]|nr:hypothetical protein [Acidimicrobiales bacterium]
MPSDEVLLRAEASALDGHKLVGVLSLNWLWLVTIPLLAGALGFYLSARQPDVFESTATVVVQPTAAQVRLGQESRSTLDPDRELETQEALLNSDVMESLVQAQLPGEEVEFRAELDFGTELIYIIYSADSLAKADEGANMVAEVYLQQRRERERRELDSAVEALQDPITSLEERLNEVTDRIVAAGGPEAASAALLSERDALTGELASARSSVELLRLESAVTTGGAELWAPAVGTEDPVAPNPARSAVIWFVLGSLLAIGVVWLREQFDDGLLSRPPLDEE